MDPQLIHLQSEELDPDRAPSISPGHLSNMLTDKHTDSDQLLLFLCRLWYQYQWSWLFGVFFQNEAILVQLDELDELFKVIHAWIRIHLQFHRRHLLVSMADCCRSDLSSIPDLSTFWEFFLVNPSNQTRILKKKNSNVAMTVLW